MSMQFDATYYMDVRPDVLAAYVNSGAEAGTGLTWAAFAEQHYNDFGWKEGYNPNAIFDTSEYLAANIDVLNAGVNPFEHYLTHGVNEGRAPNASFPKFADFDADAYLAANSDLGEAGIDTAEEAYAHFVMHGQFEDRPGAPVVEDPATKGETYNLTIGVDEYTGTAKNDTFNAVPVNPADSSQKDTLNNWDSLDGGAGVDTLNIYTDTGGYNTTQQGTVKNIEIINIHNKSAAATFGGDAIDASKFVGSEQIWQNNFATGVSNVAATQTVGIRDTAANTGSSAYVISAAAAATSLSVALDEAGAGENAEVSLSLTGDKVKTVNLSGTIGSEGGALTLAELPEGLETVNLSMDSETNIGIYTPEALEAFSGLKTLNGASSTGDLVIELGRFDWVEGEGEEEEVLTFTPVDAVALETLSTGSGDDEVVFSLSSLTADSLSVSLGAGDDLVQVNFDEESSVDVTIATGAGEDVIFLTGGNLTLDDDALTGSVTITDFNSGQDSLIIDSFTGFTAQNLVNAVIGGAKSLLEAVEELEALLGDGGTNITDYAKFTFEGNTYLYGNVNEELGLEGDLLIGFTGIVDLNNDNVAQLLA